MPPERTAAPGGLVTVPGVELARVGTWATSTGVFTFTLEDFAAAVAAEHDPEVWDAPIKIGHTDPRFSALDGEPALGWAANLRVEGDRLIGDLVNVPAALASVIPAAWPRRSVELAFDVSTPSGRKYKAAVIGVALLGVTPPAVAGLADVLKIYGGDSTFQVAAAASASTTTVLLADGFSDPIVVRALVAARAAVGALMGLPGVAPSFTTGLIAALDAVPSHTAAPPPGHTVPGDHRPSGGPPMPPLTEQRVRELLQLEETADAEAALVRLRDAASAGTTPPPGTPPGTTAPPAPGTTTTAPGAPGTQPGTAPGATPPAPTAPATGAPAGTTPPPAADPAAPPAAPATAPVPAMAGTPVPGQPGLVTVDAAAFATIQAQAAAGAAAAATLGTQARETALAAAVTQGRLVPASIASWRAAWDAEVAAAGAPTNTQALLSALPQVFPVAELGGADPAAGDAVADDAAWGSFYSSLGWDSPAVPKA